ncbi:phosphatase PAP2 family protein [Methylobacterium oxalidis]|uniref:Inositolphosphotransferase Aur1/Ipt1 domain-containing protein n=1 Tax=Methylobacterium oxalidis TaxID=944322 RepID=A0A512J0K3_9HYPH|nr:phosphatase PAP2 family protein [Methylobacterium oxalidis]GEP03467.1 hypothetical protein MOX02_15050 [Methylobacterium oxalidis]GJE32819.1 hypothetical protein LDDCCGHA_3013 [Methylobacterium oxalidis]GLS66614.1 hypothetical protein GCM10007888_49970 [Methylobacterium oxalidis]
MRPAVHPEIRASAQLWHGIAAVAVVTGLALAWAGLRVDWGSVPGPLLAVVACALGSAYYGTLRMDERASVLLGSAAQLVAFTALAGPLSYAVARAGGPLWDGTLHAWDRAIGLDWRAYLAFVNDRPRLGLILSLAYQSIMPQIAVILLVLALSGRLRACRDFVLATMLAALGAVVISGLMPAMAMFVHLDINRLQDFPHLDPAAAFVHVADLNGLRDGSFRTVSLNHLEGIITFPSFHAALAAIFAHAFWQHRWTRWPGLALNLAMIAATPIDGGHYFVDVLAGLGLAALAIRLARGFNLRALGRSAPAVQAAAALRLPVPR